MFDQAFRTRFRASSGVTPVLEDGALGSPVLFENRQTFIPEIGAAHVKLLHALRFCILDRMPENEGVSSHLAVANVTATVLIDKGLLVGDRKNAGDSNIVLKGNPNFEVGSQRRDESLEPLQWLREIGRAHV